MALKIMALAMAKTATNNGLAKVNIGIKFYLCWRGVGVANPPVWLRLNSFYCGGFRRFVKITCCHGLQPCGGCQPTMYHPMAVG